MLKSGPEAKPVAVEDVLQQLAAAPAQDVDDPYRALRRREAPAVLEDASLTWMAKLPREVQPRLTGAKYPRIVNRLAGLWGDKEEAAAYVGELLVDTRGSRKGFPADISTELETLRAHLKKLLDAAPAGAWRSTQVMRSRFPQE